MRLLWVGGVSRAFLRGLAGLFRLRGGLGAGFDTMKLFGRPARGATFDFETVWTSGARGRVRSPRSSLGRARMCARIGGGSRLRLCRFSRRRRSRQTTVSTCCRATAGSFASRRIWASESSWWRDSRERAGHSRPAVSRVFAARAPGSESASNCELGRTKAGRECSARVFLTGRRSLPPSLFSLKELHDTIDID